jgi:hypothetical protein
VHAEFSFPCSGMRAAKDTNAWGRVHPNNHPGAGSPASCHQPHPAWAGHACTVNNVARYRAQQAQPKQGAGISISKQGAAASQSEAGRSAIIQAGRSSTARWWRRSTAQVPRQAQQHSPSRAQQLTQPKQAEVHVQVLQAAQQHRHSLPVMQQHTVKRRTSKRTKTDNSLSMVDA